MSGEGSPVRYHGLQRKKPPRAQPRGKGNRAERAVIDILHAFGWKGARRNFQSGGQGGGDIIGGPEGLHLEVKHRERCLIWDWIAQAEAEARPTDVPVVVFRRNRSGWKVCVDLDEYLSLVALRERGQVVLEVKEARGSMRTGPCAGGCMAAGNGHRGGFRKPGTYQVWLVGRDAGVWCSRCAGMWRDWFGGSP